MYHSLMYTGDACEFDGFCLLVDVFLNVSTRLGFTMWTDFHTILLSWEIQCSMFAFSIHRPKCVLLRACESSAGDLKFIKW